MAVRTNKDKLIAVSVMGNIVAPTFPGLPAMPYQLSSTGEPFLLPTYGGLVYNVSVGDSVFGWMADCIHPGVSISLKDDVGNRGLNIYSCVGNTAICMSGSATGARGVVTGKSGRFSEHVIIHFTKADREKMAVGDKIVVKSFGVGMELADHLDVKLKSCAPDIVEALEVTTLSNGKLGVPVVRAIPPHLLGAGAGLTSEGGSLHIQTTDKEELRKYGLEKLRFGDVVALLDYDSRYNHGYLRGAVGIGVVSQGDSPRSGYGPGVTLIMTTATGGIEPQISEGVNLVELLNLKN